MGHYSIVFEGRIAPGARPEEVKRRLAGLYRVELDKIDRLFRGRPIIIKKNLDRESARTKKAGFEQTGALCRIVPPQDAMQPEAGAAAADVGEQATESRKGSLFQPRRKPANPRLYRIYHPLYMAFYSRDLYRDAARNWKGFAYTYLLFILTLATLASTFQIQHRVSNFVDRSVKTLVGQIPAVTIVDGEISVDCAQPCIIVDPDTGKDLAILDTTGQVTSLQETDAVMLLTHNQLIYRKSARETRILDLSGVEELRIDHQTIQGWLDFVRRWLALIIAPFILIGSFFYRLIQVLVYALIAYILAKIVHIDLPFNALVSIAVVGITPALMFTTLAGLLGVALPQAKFLSFLITAGFLYFAVRANATSAGADFQPA